MKKILLITLLMYGVSCSNPEDNATGNPDSTSFNLDEEKVLNSPGERLNSTSQDTSVAPSLDSKNANSKTSGTNRPYTPGGNSTK